jgi:hypothetical protein
MFRLDNDSPVTEVMAQALRDLMDGEIPRRDEALEFLLIQDALESDESMYRGIYHRWPSFRSVCKERWQ